MEFKSLPVELKASADEVGVFEARVSVFGNVDSYGDRMVKGAFARTLKEHGLPPVLWSHDFFEPPIGMTLSAEETDLGLEVKARLFVGDGEDSTRAREVNTAMKAGALKEFSFAYNVAPGGSREVEEDGKTIRELLDVDLIEVSPVLVGANPETELLTPPKSATELLIARLEENLRKAGARNAAGDLERLQGIHDLSVENGAKCAIPEGDAGDAGDDGEKASAASPRVAALLCPLSHPHPIHKEN